MSKTKKRTLTWVICIVLAALVCLIGYRVLFVGQDTLSVARSYRIEYADKKYTLGEEDVRIGADGLLYVTGGKYVSLLRGNAFLYETVLSLPDAKSTTLTAYEATEDRYIKLGDVSQPSGFSVLKTADDLDENPLTSQFTFSMRDSAEGPVLMCIYAYGTGGKTLSDEGFSEVTITYPQDGSAKAAAKAKVSYDGYLRKSEKQTLCLFASPYDNWFICVELSHPEGCSESAIALSLYEAAAKITPGKQLHPRVDEFKLNFLDDSRWKYLCNGLGITMLITFCSGLMGVVLGAIVAIIRATWEKNHENMRPGPGKACLKAADKLCGIYLTVIRGTPVMVQLLIMYLIIFASASNGTVSAILAFGINSGAYVAEIVRGGIMSIDNGQFEAGASLGFNYTRTMIHIIMPQAFKNILPSLANEFIALLKETSVSGYVAVKDLNKGGDIIRSVTYSPFMPLIAVALIYLAVVMFFTKLVALLERRLRSNEHK